MSKAQSKPKTKSWLWGDASRVAHGFDRIMLYEFDLLEEHREFVEDHFSRSLARFEKRFEEEVAKIKDPEVRAEYADHLVDEYHRLSNDMPRLQWYAQFLMVYATFEDALNELCRIVQHKTDRGLTLKDLSGQGITRAANFLAKVHEVKVPFQSKEWNDAQLLGEIRNAIAHRNGEIEYEVSKQSSLAHRLQKLEGVELKQPFVGAEMADIVLKPLFVGNAIKTLRGILASVANHKLSGNES